MKKFIAFLAMLLTVVTTFAATSPWLKFYLPTTAASSTTIKFSVTGTLSTTPLISYAKMTAGASTYSWTAYTLGNEISLDPGDIVYFSAPFSINKVTKLTEYKTNDTFSESSSKYIQFSSTNEVYASGNIMSLFKANCSITEVPEYAFFKLFYNCSNLKSAPELPATTLNKYCYSQMFSYCSGLTSAPELPAETLKDYCYNQMFSYCEGLTSAPNISATTLASHCCYRMFRGCSNLSSVKASFTGWAETDDATTQWLSDVSATGTFTCPKALDTTTKNESRVPIGWNVARPVTKPDNCLCFTTEEAGNTVRFNASSSWFDDLTYSRPDIVYSTDGTTFCDYLFIGTAGDEISLPNAGDKVYFMALDENSRFSVDGNYYLTFSADKKIAASGSVMTLLNNTGTTAAVPDYAFYNLFNGCGQLTAAPELGGTILANHCYDSMFKDCTGLTTAPELPAETLSDHCYSSMFKGCTGLTKYPTTLVAETLASYCYQSMFEGCTSLAGMPGLPATTLSGYCYASMFKGCTSLGVMNTALPAELLVDHCYYEMFSGCSKLNYVIVPFTDFGTDVNATTDWLKGVSSDGTGMFACPNALTVPEKSVSTVPADWYVWRYEIEGKPDNCLTFTSEESENNIALTANADWNNDTYAKPSLVYSTDGTYFFDYDLGTKVSLGAGGVVYFMALDENEHFSCDDSYNCITFSADKKVAASGSVMTLLNRAGTAEDVPDYAFYNLFMDCDKLTAAPELTGKTLGVNCYENMFRGCTGLTSAPELPAKTLAEYCYSNMFNGCTGITAAPELPATTLASACYYNMFRGCTGLTSAPELPATTLAEHCYRDMFHNCSSLTTAPELPATTLVAYCYHRMFAGCKKLNSVSVNFTEWNGEATGYWLSSVAETGTFCCSGSLDMSTRNYNTVPEGWNVVNTDPLCITVESRSPQFNLCQYISSGYDVVTPPSLLYSTDGVNYEEYTFQDVREGYNNRYGAYIDLPAGGKVYFKAKDKNETFSTEHSFFIFSSTSNFTVSGNIMSLLDASCRQTSVPEYAFFELFYGSNVTDASKLQLPAKTLADYCYACMFDNCTKLTTAPELPATTMAPNCYQLMFHNCPLTTAPELPATTLAPFCYYYMFDNCRSLTAAPELPATTLAPYCYSYMFYGCTQLNSIKVGFTEWNYDSYRSTLDWVMGVASSGTFTCPRELDQTQTGIDYIPEGWTRINVAAESIVGIADLIYLMKAGSSQPEYDFDGNDKIDLDDLNTLVKKVLNK